ncbi:MAG: peptidyl-prolyl cis-trans isomerase [Gammaproteobacteria bacterium]|nr:peptidyl-prolyl cis-trans isomerase [Gammaproteobacteria bacterium]
MKNQTRLITVLREPLLHFLVIGAALFIIFSLINDTETKTDNRIIITRSDLSALATTWLKRMGRPPSASEREQQLKHYIREQILAREAVTMGLDQGDIIIRRRLSQKMQYLFDDLSIIPEPTEADLAEFLSMHAEKFTQLATLSFSQIYLEPGEHKQDIKKDAEQLLKQLKEDEMLSNAINMGDRSLLPYEFNNERESEISSLFGAEFSKQIFILPVNRWQGPITSEYGLHLIYIHSRTETRLPPLAEIQESVIKQWRTTKQREANEIFYQSIYQRYEIILDYEETEDALLSVGQ